MLLRAGAGLLLDGNSIRTAEEPARELPVIVEELTPAPAPADVFERLARLPHVLFLDSAARHSSLGRYSFVTADPYEWLTSSGSRVQVFSESRPRESADPFAVLAERLASVPLRTVPGLPPFQGGAAGLFGYDLCHQVERLPRPRFDEFETPDMAVGLYDWVVGFDHAVDKAWLISTGFPEMDPHRRAQRAKERARAVQRQVRNAATVAQFSPSRPIKLSAPQFSVPGVCGLTSNFNRAGYLATVARAIEYVHAGDCFQVNLAQRLVYPQKTSALQLYLRLRERNPAPFAGCLDLGEFVIASASPERFLRLYDGEAQARPIKGTRPRGETPIEDALRAAELSASAKDRSENIMIVDLLRNDLGRVCRYGSVRVPALCGVESYRHVHHLVSEVRGRLRDGMGPIDLLRAAFPGGSVTGAPKIRAMEIIAELEPTTRGPYCGSLGYIGFDGSMDTSILIRTFSAGRGWLQFPVGGGIVADSIPEREYAETWHKAEGLLRAL
jgi:para-aminobenzoate synthetase component 1